jgi:hypothetical protein
VSKRTRHEPPRRSISVNRIRLALAGNFPGVKTPRSFP